MYRGLELGDNAGMCNLYSVTTNREAMRLIAKAMNDSLGNFPELPSIYPDYVAPIVRLNAAGEREIVLARWGLPSLKDQPTEKPNKGTTNVRHPWFYDWKEYLGTALKYLPGVDGIPSGDPLRLPIPTPDTNTLL